MADPAPAAPPSPAPRLRPQHRRPLRGREFDRHAIRRADIGRGLRQIKRVGSIPLHAGEKSEQRSGMATAI